MIRLSEYIIDYNLVSKVNIELLKKEITIPIKEEELYILIAIYNDKFNEYKFNTILDKPLKTIKTSRTQILQALHNFEKKRFFYEISLTNTTKDANIDVFLIELLKHALSQNTSDIHMESQTSNFLIRFRIDGILKHIITLKKDFFNTLSSYIKLKSNLDISLKRLPQDSSFSMIIEDKKYDCRVSTMSTIEGESIVLRILKNNTQKKNLDSIGFSEKSYLKIKQQITQANGLILITGPTGSGKTTTLYSMIKEINYTGKKIITIEDPVEYKIQNIQQITVKNEIGLSFEKILTNILRQDPDVILIGEIRDKLSLKIAIQASLTGHLVFATLHTNNALSTINRVLDLGGEPFLLASTLKMIISQRLVRKLCDSCKVFDIKTNTYIASTCEKCNFEGYMGRAILYEMLNIDESLSNMIAKKQNNEEILSYLQKNGYLDIKQFSNDMLKNGISSIEEIYKVLPYE